jgi:ABC-type multidrug transport system fused ATPase/permease subunit
VVVELTSGILKLFEGRDRRKAAGILAMIVISSLVETVGVASIAPFLAVVTAPEAIEKNVAVSVLYHVLGAESVLTFQIYLGIVTAGMIVFSNAVASLTLWLMCRFIYKQKFLLGCRLFGIYLAQPYLYFLQHNTVDLARNVYDEVPRAINGVVLPAFHVVAKSFSIIMIVALLVYIDATVSFIVFFIFGGSYLLLYKVLQRRSRGVYEAISVMRAATLRIASEALGGIKELKVLGSEMRCVEIYAVPASAISDAEARHQIFATLPKYLLETIGFVGIVLIVLFLIVRGDPQFNALPVVAVFAFAGYRLMPALQHLYTYIHFIQYDFPALKTVVADLDRDAQRAKSTPKAEPVKAVEFKRSVDFDNVTFRYPSTQAIVLDGVSLQIKAKTVTGVVGTTGAGKSTLLDIFLGLLEPTSGQLRVDGQVLDASKIRSWQAGIGYVPQQIFLTDGTISENIAFGQFRNDIDMQRVSMAGKAAHVDEFVQDLADGYETKVGERGIRLSGGQRQRIGIARALYRNPALLIFDEATSALDNLTELAVMDTLQGLMDQKTIILVAHRLSTLRICNQIIVLEGGRVTDQGTYDELLARSAFFQQLHNAGRPSVDRAN